MVLIHDVCAADGCLLVAAGLPDTDHIANRTRALNPQVYIDVCHVN